MPVGSTKTGVQERPDIPLSTGETDYPSAQTEQVEIIVFNALLGGEKIVDERGPNAFYFVCYYGYTYSTAADGNTALYVTRHNGLSQGHHKVGVVVGIVFLYVAKVGHVVAQFDEVGPEYFFKIESTMIGGNSYFHEQEVVNRDKRTDLSQERLCLCYDVLNREAVKLIQFFGRR